MTLEEFCEGLKQDKEKNGTKWMLTEQSKIRDEHFCCPIEAYEGHKISVFDTEIDHKFVYLIVAASDFQPHWQDYDAKIRQKLTEILEPVYPVYP